MNQPKDQTLHVAKKAVEVIPIEPPPKSQWVGRDASFAQTALQALEDTGGPVLVITGNGHARTDWGVPFYLDLVAPDAQVISVGQLVTGEIAPPYDRWIMTGGFDAGEGDPCDRFSRN